MISVLNNDIAYTTAAEALELVTFLTNCCRLAHCYSQWLLQVILQLNRTSKP